MPSEHECPKCGAVLPADAPKGLCPRCLMAAALEQSRPAAGKPTIRVEPDSREEPIEKIDRYKILQKLGEGGCGVVYMAEQTEPVRRKVAVKVIKLGMDTKQVIARFEAERQALALMDHPNIAKVLDGGATEKGRPYFVMELVKGIRITDYCDQNHLSTAERLGLFTQVCQAIQHAHQKGIIHRDIKPSNILVTLHDGKPVPKVIDFGIAKATEQPLTMKTVFTAFGQFMGTPAYMSPEQAELSGLDIDTRSDIYALGVLLYELLTGKTPFDAKELLQAGLDEMRRRIREEEPMRPSTRLSTMMDADLTEVAEQRQAEPGKLTRFIRGDLDWIVMKCLEKDRTRRYETANGLATDIRRHLENEPVLACPPSTVYRFQKLVRRNKLAVAAVTAVVAALVIGLGIATWQFLEKSKAFNRAVAAENQARTQASKSQNVSLFLQKMLDGVAPSVALGRDTQMLKEILDSTAKRVGMDLKDQPEVEADLRMILGKTYAELGFVTNALVMTQEALRLRQLQLGPTNIGVADALANLGVLLYSTGNTAGAEEFDRKALAMRITLLGNEHTNVAMSLNNLGVALWHQGKLAEAEEVQQRALAMRRKLLPADHPNIGMSLLNLGTVMDQRGNLAGAETNFATAFELLKRISADGSPLFATLQGNLATLLSQRGDLTAADELFQKNLELNRKLFKGDHPQVAYMLIQQGIILAMLGDLDRAEARLREALAMQKRMGDSKDADLSDALYGLGITLTKRGDWPGAQTALERALAGRIEILRAENNADVVDVLDALAVLAIGRDDLAAAERWLNRAVTAARKSESIDYPGYVPPLWHLSWVLARRGDATNAAACRREALAISSQHEDYGTWPLIRGIYDLADVMVNQGKFSAAERLLCEAADNAQKYAGDKTAIRAMAYERLARFYEAWDRAVPNSDKSASAAAWRRQLEELNALPVEKQN
jgi:eukaryotic-like serine/threonine-protein kinase